MPSGHVSVRDSRCTSCRYRKAKAGTAADDTFRPTHDTTAQGFTSFIHDISRLLEEVGMEVKQGREEVGKGVGWVVLVSTWCSLAYTDRPLKTNSDPNDIALSASDYNPLEIAYYRAIVRPLPSPVLISLTGGPRSRLSCSRIRLIR